MDALPRGRLLAARGRLTEAAALLDVQVAIWANPIDVLRALERARVRERLGNRERAVTDYAFVANSWQNADPELQPFVQEAKAALQRLVAEPRR